MKEVRRLTAENLSRACIKNNWYTLGDCKEYDTILTYANELSDVTTDKLKKIATDIKVHSDTEYDVPCIMFILANEYCNYLFFEEDIQND